MAKQDEWKEQKSNSYNPLFMFEKIGAELIGEYKGSRLVEKTGSTIHTLEKDGADVDFWGTGKLDFLLKTVAAGTTIKVVYKGRVKAKVQIGKKQVMKEIHDFQLFTK